MTNMKTFGFLLLPLLPLAASNPIFSRTAAKCDAPADDVCAQFVYADGTVSQDILITDGGCEEVRDPGGIRGIVVYDCWCNLWK
jgi:hypothetical protein